MAEYVGGELMAVGVGDPITFENKTDDCFSVDVGIVFHKSGLYRVTVDGKHTSVEIEPERKTGEWIDDTFCSECGWVHEVEPESYKEKLKEIADALSEKFAYMNTCLNERDIILSYLGVKRCCETHCNTDCTNTKCESHSLSSAQPEPCDLCSNLEEMPSAQPETKDDAVSKLIKPAEDTSRSYMELGWPYNFLAACNLEELIDLPISDEQIDILENKVLKTLRSVEETCVLSYYKSDNKTLREIGKEFGLSGQRIQQIIKKAERKMRHPSRWKLIKYPGLDIAKFNSDILKTEELRRKYIEKLNSLKVDNEKLKKVIDILEGLNEPLDDVEEVPLYDRPFVSMESLSVRTANCILRCCCSPFPKWRFAATKIDYYDIPETARRTDWAVEKWEDITIGQIVYLFETGLITKIRNLGKSSIIEIANALVSQGVNDPAVVCYLN